MPPAAEQKKAVARVKSNILQTKLEVLEEEEDPPSDAQLSDSKKKASQILFGENVRMAEAT